MEIWQQGTGKRDQNHRGKPGDCRKFCIESQHPVGEQLKLSMTCKAAELSFTVI